MPPQQTKPASGIVNHHHHRLSLPLNAEGGILGVPLDSHEHIQTIHPLLGGSSQDRNRNPHENEP